MSFLILWGCISSVSEEITSKENNEVPRIVAIGDLHADFERSLEIFQLAGLTDDKGRWIAKNTIAVQTGDVTDRGEDGEKTLKFIQRLEQESKGNFIPLMGNHEAMNIVGDWRYVNPKDIEGFGGLEKRKEQFSANGSHGSWILDRKVVAKVGENIFTHGGIRPEFAKLGVEGITSRLVNALKTGSNDPVLGPEGPLWYRGHLLAEESIACAELKSVLEILNAKRLIVGHTTQKNGKIAHRCNGALLGIDIGISKHYGSNLGHVEIKNGDARAIYIDNSVDLPDPL